jgi:transposase-like protein
MTARKPGSTHPGKIRMAQLSEWMAENGGSVSEAARSLGWSPDNTKHIWRRVRQRMGPQAV